MHQEGDNIFPSFFVHSLQGSTPPLTNLITPPLCVLTEFCSDVTSQLLSWERGGASDVKKQTLTTTHLTAGQNTQHTEVLFLHAEIF